MAGGRGSRLQMGEKGLVRLCGRPLIEYVLNAIQETLLIPIVITTPRTPYTANYCRARDINQICTEGAGYIEDICEAVAILGENKPVLIVCADIPGIKQDHLITMFSRYKQESMEACSVWVPSKYYIERGETFLYYQNIEGVSAVPAGLNILHGGMINSAQTEVSLLIDDPALSFNINTRNELEKAESFFTL
jgi:adenosylcobinamide-phosphate guanylyltransferase